MKRVIGVFFIATFSLLFVTDCISQKADFTQLKGSYLGQKPPGMKPEIFAPGVICTGDYERALVFAPDQSELFFQVRGRRYNTFLVHMKKIDNKWNEPEMAHFSGIAGHDDDYPSFSPDGKYFDYHSLKQLLDSPGNGYGDIYWVDAGIIEALKSN